MTHEYEMVDQNILLYEARLKHIDDFCCRAEKLIQKYPKINIEAQLIPIKAARKNLAALIKSTKRDSELHLSQGSGEAHHSVIWHEITQELESLLKPFEALLPMVQTLKHK